MGKKEEIQENAERKIAEIILKSIEDKIKTMFASLDGADSNYYYQLFRQIEDECQKIAEETGLSLEIVKKLAGLIGRKTASNVARGLLFSNFEYDSKAKDNRSSEEEMGQKSPEKEWAKKRDKEDELDEKTEEELEQESAPDVEILAKLSGLKQKNETKKVLKNLLFSMIAHRMDPQRRAGETAKSNVKYAELYGRGNMLTIGQLVEAGIVAKASLKLLKSFGINENSHISLHNVQRIVKEGKADLLELIKNFGHINHAGATRIPEKEAGRSVLESFGKSLDIFSEKANLLAKESARQPTPDATPIPEKGDIWRNR